MEFDDHLQFLFVTASPEPNSKNPEWFVRFHTSETTSAPARSGTLGPFVRIQDNQGNIRVRVISENSAHFISTPISDINQADRYIDKIEKLIKTVSLKNYEALGLGRELPFEVIRITP